MKGIVTFDPRSCNGIDGTIVFKQSGPRSNVKVSIHLKGFTKSKPHALHVHEFGDISNGCHSSGGHFNPTNVTHGSIDIPNHPRHAGDLCNNIFPKRGKVSHRFTDDALTMFGRNSIIGRTVVIHEKEDDLGLGGLDDHGTVINRKVHKESLKTGNAGGRMACAIIGLAK